MTPVYAIIEKTNIANLYKLTSSRLPVEVMEVHLRRSKCCENSYCKINVFYVDKGRTVQEMIKINASDDEGLSLLSSIKCISGNNVEQYSVFFDF